MPTPHDLLLARIALEHGLLSPGEVERCWAKMASAAPPASFATVAQDLEVLSPFQLAALHDMLRQRAEATAIAKVDTRASTPAAASREAEPDRDASRDRDRPTVMDVGFGTDPAAGTATRPPRFGRYVIAAELGRGGMGVVYLAYDTRMGRTVALKVMLSDAVGSEEARTRFRREAHLAARMQHPNIVPVYDEGEIDGTLYFTMELVRGETLQAVLRRMKVLPVRVAMKIAREAAVALHYAHERMLIHRDVKPGNILIAGADGPDPAASADGSSGSLVLATGPVSCFRVLVTDFGLARSLAAESRLTHTGEILGTPVYMSPEQADGREAEVGPVTDVYCLGTVLYEMLCGKPPFVDESNALRLMAAVILQDPEPLRRRRPDLDADVATIVAKAMEKDPPRRYADAREMAEDIDRWLRGEAIRARPPGPVERLTRVLRRHRAAATGIAGVAVALVALGAWLLRPRVLAPEVADLVRRAREEVQRIEPPTLPEGSDPEAEDAAAGKVRDRLHRALALVDDALARDPEYAFGHRARAELLLRMGAGPEAVASLDRARELEPEDADWTYLRARALEETSGGGEAARRTLKELLSRAPPPSVAAFARARLALAAQEPDGVFRALEGLPGGEIEPIEAARLRAAACGLRGADSAKQEALREIDVVLRTGQATFMDYSSAAIWAQLLGRFDLCRALLVMALGHTDVRVGPLLWRGKLRQLESRPDLARRDFDLAIEAAPESSTPWLSRAHLRRQQGDFEGAQEDLLHVLAREPNNVLVHIHLIQLHRYWAGRGDPVARYRQARASGRLDPATVVRADWGATLALVGELLELDLLDDALEWIAAGRDVRPDDPDLASLEGQVRFRLREPDLARAAFDRAIRSQPHQYKLYVWRARCHGMMRDYRPAAADLGRAIDLDPQNRDLYLKRAGRLLQLGDLKRALTDIETAAMKASLAEVEQLRGQLERGSLDDTSEKVDAATVHLARMFFPALSDRLSVRGHAALARGDGEAARAAFEKAKVIDPTRWRPLYGLAAVHCGREEWDLAVFRLEEAIQRDWRDGEQWERDPAFAAFRRRPEYARVRGKIEALTQTK